MPIARADGRELVRVIVYVAPAQKKKLAIMCAEQNITISDRVAELIKDFVGES